MLSSSWSNVTITATVPEAVEFDFHYSLYCPTEYMACECFNIAFLSNHITSLSIPQSTNNTSLPGKSNQQVWMTFSVNTSQQTQTFDKSCSMGWLYLQRKYVGKPGEHVTKALFQKTEAGNAESGSHLQAKECLLGKELQMLVVRWVLISWILLPKQSFSGVWDPGQTPGWYTLFCCSWVPDQVWHCSASN